MNRDTTSRTCQEITHLQLQPLGPAQEVADAHAKHQRQDQDDQRAQEEIHVLVALVAVRAPTLELYVVGMKKTS